MRRTAWWWSEGVGHGSAREQREAEDFYSSLMGWPSGDDAEDIPGCACGLDANGQDLVRRLATTIERSLGTTTPHEGRAPVASRGPSLTFNGSWDYHSAMHGHWAVLGIFRMSGDAAGQARILARLSEATLQQEWAFLRSPQMAWERPYGVAWLAMLLAEVSRASGRNTAALQTLRREVEAELLDHLEHTPMHDEAVIGLHGSWLFALLLLVMSEPITTGIQARISALVTGQVHGDRAWLRSRRVLQDEFLSTRALLDTLDLLRGLTPPTSPAPDLPTARLSAGHALGLPITRLWPVAVRARTSPAACLTFRRHLAAWRAHPQHWEYGPDPTTYPARFHSRFMNNAHWIPQFLWMAIRLSCG